MEVIWCQLGFSNQPGAYKKFHFLYLLGTWGIPNAFRNVVCDQLAADIPEISSCVCSTFVVFQNRIHFNAMGTEPRASLYKGTQHPQQQRLSCAACTSTAPCPQPWAASGASTSWASSQQPPGCSPAFKTASRAWLWAACCPEVRKRLKISMGISEAAWRAGWCQTAGSGAQPRVSME